MRDLYFDFDNTKHETDAPIYITSRSTLLHLSMCIMAFGTDAYD